MMHRSVIYVWCSVNAFSFHPLTPSSRQMKKYPGMGRHRLLCFSLVAGSLLVADSLAVVHLQTTSRYTGRRRSWRLNDALDDNSDSIHSIKNTSHSTTSEEEVLSIWPKGDALDRRMMKIALPCIANFAINPLIGAVDLFWVNRMGDALAVAGQSAANQVFSSAFWIISVLPSGKWLCL